MTSMRQVSGVLMVCGVLSACAATPRPSMDASADMAVFQCGDYHVETRYHDDAITLRIGSHELTLPQAISASGARFKDGANEFWNSGSEALLTLDGTRSDCHIIQ